MNVIIHEFLHVAFVFGAITAFGVRGSAACSSSAYGNIVLLEAGILLLVGIVQVLLHVFFYITYQAKGTLPFFKGQKSSNKVKQSE